MKNIGAIIASATALILLTACGGSQPTPTVTTTVTKSATKQDANESRIKKTLGPAVSMGWHSKLLDGVCTWYSATEMAHGPDFGGETTLVIRQCMNGTGAIAIAIDMPFASGDGPDAATKTIPAAKKYVEKRYPGIPGESWVWFSSNDNQHFLLIEKPNLEKHDV